MKLLRLTCLLSGLLLLGSSVLRAQERPNFFIESLDPAFRIELDPATGAVTATNGVAVRYGDAVLTARTVLLNRETGDVVAEGAVHLQRGKEVWSGERVQYNFETRTLGTDSFRSGQAPFFVAGAGLVADQTNNLYSATNAFVTTDDVAVPGYRIRASRITVHPGNSIEARDAVAYVGEVPVFYFPYWHRSLTRHPNNFAFTPGYRSRYGAFLLGTYNWYASTNLQGAVHLDYRQLRGVGGGPNVAYDLGRLGHGNGELYYLHDEDPMRDVPTNAVVKADRYRISFTHSATLATDLTAKVVLRQQGDAYIERDFFEAQYRGNVQPSSFLEVNQVWPNFSLNFLAQPRVNDFYDTVERLPDVKLSALRQQLGALPLYYESESSLGYFRHRFADNTTNAFAALRADTYHQILLPYTFFGWLNVTPRVGGRFTHYGEADGFHTTTTEENRGVFNTGAEVSFKASRVFRESRSKFWDVTELRHIVEPSINYVYVPSPNVLPPQLPQFDSELPSFRLLPVTFPDYNSIDSIDSQNVLRFALRNKLQTKRAEGVDHLINWALYTDWRLKPRAGQSTFADVYSDLDLKPRSWLTFNSELRYDLSAGHFRLAQHTATIQPNTTWGWTIGHRYLRDDPGYGVGNNLVTSSLYYRIDENWGLRASHHFEARDGTMEEQYYSIYRDLRSWTSALTLRIRDQRESGGKSDFTVAVTFSVKAFPRFKLGRDKDTPSLLLGG